MAKLIIKLINAVGEVVNRDPACATAAVVFLPNFNVSNGQRVYPGGRPLRADLDRRQGGLGHRQHEVHDERRADHRHARRREHRDPRGGRRRELLPVRLTAEEVAALWRRATGPMDYYESNPELRAVLDLIAAASSRAATASCSGRSSTACCTTTRTCCSPTSSPTSTASSAWRAPTAIASAGRACRS
jgi:glycogen phosphorylase